jgi:ElaB/YqjD/DUF883 family membrane-anchored ribosome-binding protein
MSMDTDRLEADVQESRHRLNDTITELGSKLSPGQMLDEGIGLLQGQAGRFAGQLGRQVRDNPLPVVLIGAGIAWLVVSSRKSSSAALERQSEDEYHQRRYRTIEEARWANPRLPSETDEAYEERVHQAYSSALGLKQLAGEAANEFKDRVGGAYSDSRDKLGSFASSGKERLGALASDARTMAGEQAQHLRETAEEARARAERFYDDAPIAAGAIALAIGALVGALTPLSSPERRTLRGLAEGAVNRGAGLAERGIRAVGDRLDGALH